MSTISSAGIGSGLNVDSIVTQLMAVERQPLNALASKSRALDSKISAFGAIKSQLSTLNDAVSKLAAASTWDAKSPTSSNSAAVGISVSDSSAAQSTSFNVTVSQLARSQSVASSVVAASAGFKSGTLSIQLGTWSGSADAPSGNTGGSGSTPTFSPGAAGAISIQIASNDTLSGIAAKINAADAGVSATVLRDSSGDRLLLNSKSTGQAKGFRIESTDDASPGGGTSGSGGSESNSGLSLSALAFDPAAGSGGMAANPVQYALDTHAAINGVSVTSSSRVLADTVPGLAISVFQLSSEPVQITVANDTVAMRSAIDGFVSAYNAMNGMLNAATKYDAATKSAALLQGDSTTTGLQSALRRMVGTVSGGGALQRLSDLGVSITRDAGDLVVDSGRLDAALKSPQAAKQFLSAAINPTQDSATGFATRFAAFAQAAVASDGSLTGKTTALQSQKTGIGRDQDRLNNRLTYVEQRLRKQYTSLDTTVSSLTALNNYISQQVAQWNRSR